MVVSVVGTSGGTNGNPIEGALMLKSSEQFAEYVRGQSRWRESKASEFPDDRRNSEGAQALRSLAEWVDAREAERGAGEVNAVLDILSFHVSADNGAPGGPKAQRLLSRYGYGHGVTDYSHERLISDLIDMSMEDAYDYACEHGVDPTDLLFPVELEAAELDIAMPPSYWTHRLQTDKVKLEAEIGELRKQAAARA
jgi:hypothetical protein